MKNAANREVVNRQLVGENQLSATGAQGVAWAERNRRSLVAFAAVALGLIVLLVAAYTITTHRTAAAETAFGDAMQVYQTPLATASQTLPPGTKTFPTAADRATAANALFLSTADKYSATEPGKLARYFAGLTYMEAGKTGPAEDTLQKVAGSWNGDVAALAKLALAQIYEQTSRPNDAVALYEQLGKGKATTVPPGLAKIELAQLYTTLGKTDQARKIYAQLKDADKDAKGNPGPVGALAAQKLDPKAAAGAQQPQ